MTSKTLTFIDLHDIRAFHMKCAKCETSVNVPLQSVTHKVPERCPNCDKPWGRIKYNKPTYQFIVELADAIDRLAGETSDASATGFIISLEVSGLVPDVPA